MEDKNKIEELNILGKEENLNEINKEKVELKNLMDIEKENKEIVNHFEIEKEKGEKMNQNEIIKEKKEIKNNFKIMEEKDKKEDTKKLLGRKRELKEEKTITEQSKEDKQSTQKEIGDKSEYELNNSNSDLKTEKEKPKKSRAKKKSEMKRDDIIMRILKKIRDIKKKEVQKTLEEYIKNGFENFIKKKEYDYLYEYDFFLYVLIRHISVILDDFKDFKEDYTYYIYNNLRVLTFSKELNEALKKMTYNKDNESFYQQFIKFTKNRWDLFIASLEKYKCKLLDDYKRSIDPEEKKKKQNNNRNNNNNANNNSANNNANNQNKDNNNNSNTPTENKEPEPFDMSKAIEVYKEFPEDNQLEIMIAGVVFNSLLKIEKDIPKEPKSTEKDKNSIIPTNPVKVEIQNFNLSEMAMVSVISGIKFYTNITEINISGNPLSLKSCFWLGSAFKTNPNILILDISRCNIDNERLYLFIEGTKFTDEKFNNEQFNLERLNLKDNNQITSKSVEGFEYPLALLLEKFKLKWINLTNAKINGEGALKLMNKMEELLNINKLYLENLILICNDFKNEECLSKLGDVLIKENCPIKNIILSKNLISTKTNNDSNINHFEKLMECLGKSKLKELFLISCDIGCNENDINILCKMLEENKSLISLRLFGNKLNRMDWFTKILSLFSDFQGPLINNTLKSLDLSKNSCNIKVNEDDSKFMKLVEHLKLEYLDVNQNMMEASDKETFKKKTNDLTNIKIIY